MFSKFTVILTLIICLFSCESSNSEHNKEDMSEKSQQNPGVAHGLSLEQEGHRRNYLLYLPKTYTGNKQYPLVFNFHGFGASHTNHMRYADLREKADSEGFILVYPEGITRQKGGNEWDPSPILQDSNIKNNDVRGGRHIWYPFSNDVIWSLFSKYNLNGQLD